LHGRGGEQGEARKHEESSGPAPSDEERRLAELGRVAPAALLFFSDRGALLAQNDAARATFETSSLAHLLGSEEAAADLFATVRRRGRLIDEAELTTRGGRVWFLLNARLARDPATGALAVALSAEDLTERRSADRAKDEFISIVSHELRTPLTAIRGAVGLLTHEVAADPEQRAELCAIAWENVMRLGRLVDDLLDVQRLQLGAVDLVLATLELAPLAQETLDMLEPRAADAGVALRVVDRAPGAKVRCDPGRLVQAIANLVTNALKHAPRGSTITVEIQDRSPMLRLFVRDEGPGVPAEFVSRLFEPFSQADSTDARSAGGAGLGLYIVRTLIRAHGGTVGYDASAAGGAAFYFDLPAAHDSSLPGDDG
jgi:signal transduction histidine kinase